MNKSRFWGFEVSHILVSFCLMVLVNFVMSMLGWPLFVSWLVGIATLVLLRLLSIGQKTGHLELWLRFMAGPHLFLGHKRRGDQQ